MFWIVLFFVAGTAAQTYFAWKKRQRRECGVLLGLVTVGIAFSALFYTGTHERIYPLGVLEGLFRPLTKWIYDAL